MAIEATQFALDEDMPESFTGNRELYVLFIPIFLLFTCCHRKFLKGVFQLFVGVRQGGYLFGEDILPEYFFQRILQPCRQGFWRANSHGANLGLLARTGAELTVSYAVNAMQAYGRACLAKAKYLP